MNRRRFISATVGAGALAASRSVANILPSDATAPLILSTWNHGLPANQEALKTLAAGGSALDAAERGVMVVEADPTNLSVGLGGLPDRDGIVTLDACIMEGTGRAGSVCFVQGIAHPISVARMVMERTPHVILAGAGAERYAREQGVEQRTNTLSKAAREAWEKWLEEKKYKPVINIENHDTIGLLAFDGKGTIAGACTTSGLAYKVHGRVGDSPIIGAGLYVDNEVGGATCTGVGETVLRTCASFLAVERMRMGATPQEACEEAIKRIVRWHPKVQEYQVGILALNMKGQTGAFAVNKGFSYAQNTTLHESASFVR